MQRSVTFAIVPRRPGDGSKGQEKESDSPRPAPGGEDRDTVVQFLLFMAGTHSAPIHEGGLRAH